MSALYAPFVVLGGLMLVDEARFHVRRGLPRWERIGHPMDTAVFLVALAWAAAAPAAPWSFAAYCALAVVSCLVITKDEWVHARHCSGGEHFVHALLFLLHPVALVAAWKLRVAALPLWPVLTAVAGFGCWQALYWNALRRETWPTPSTTTSTTS